MEVFGQFASPSGDGRLHGRWPTLVEQKTDQLQSRETGDIAEYSGNMTRG